MSITQETRREAYYEAKTTAPTRRRILYGALKKYGGQTVDELMHRLGYSDPNSIRPRLTELKKDGLVRTVGRRRSARTGKLVAVWEIVPMKKAAPDGGNIGDGGAPEGKPN